MIRCVFAILAGTVALQAELREFTDVKGRKITAEFLGLAGQDKVNLRMEAGKMVTVDLNRLSQADQAYISGHPASKLTPIELPEKALIAVKDWNERLQRDESYFITATGQRAFRRAIRKIHFEGYASGLWQYAVVEGPNLGILDAKGMASFGVSRAGPPGLEPGATDAPIFIGRYGTRDSAYIQYLRKDGQPFIRNKYADGRPFNSERAWVNLEAGDRPDGGQGGTWTLIDYRGNLLHAYEDLEVQDFSEGRAGVAIDERASQWRIIDTDGEEIAAGPFRRVGKFINGAAVVDGRLMDLEGQWLMEEKGEWQIERRYENSESDAIVARRTRRVAGKSRYGIIRRSTGEFIAEVPDDLYVDRGFFDGLAPVRNLKTHQYGYISRTGELLIPDKFAKAEPFQGGYAHVALETQYDKAVINLAGEVIWKARVPEAGVPAPAEKDEKPGPAAKEQEEGDPAEK